MKNLNEIQNVLSKAWSKDTCHPSYKEQWSETNKTAGQCAITSLLLNELLQYPIYDVMVGRSRHFFNKDECGNIIDLTASQFGKAEIPYEQGRLRQFNQLIHSKDVERRYKLLKTSVLNLQNNL